jgi:general secretion pathway protein F
MAPYRYRAMTPSGSVVQGAIEAADEAAVIQHIREAGHYPISAKPAGANGFSGLISSLRPAPRTSIKSLNLATQELATLLQAGLELDRALGILVGLSELGKLRQPFEAARARVRDGASLADALDGEKAFPKFYIGMVRAGEMGGTLDTTLGKLADYLGKTLAMREAVVSAFVYPVILLITAGLSIIFILTFVLPEFEPLFQQAGKSLPLAPRIVMYIGHAVQDFWWLMLLIAGGAVYWLREMLKEASFRRKVDARLLRVPVLGDLLTAMDVERFCRTLGTLLTNGVSLPEALGLAKDVCANRVLAGAVKDTAISLREGDGVAQRLRETGVFPAMTIDLIRVGEEAGKLDEMLLRQADLDEQRIRHTVDRLLAFLVPGLTVFLGLIVGGLIASMMTAILSLNDLAIQ